MKITENLHTACITKYAVSDFKGKKVLKNGECKFNNVDRMEFSRDVRRNSSAVSAEAEEKQDKPLSLVMQIGAVSGETLTVNLENLDLTNGGHNINMSTRTTAENAVSAVQSLINRVSEEKEGLGAWQSKLQSALLGIVKDAKEENGLTVGYRHPEIVGDNLAKFKDKIIANAEYSAHAHINQNPQSVLDLLM